MTETEWMACTDPGPMLDILRGHASYRKSSLYKAACCRRIWHLLPETACQEGVEIAERFADGVPLHEELANVRCVIADLYGQLRELGYLEEFEVYPYTDRMSNVAYLKNATRAVLYTVTTNADDIEDVAGRRVSRLDAPGNEAHCGEQAANAAARAENLKAFSVLRDQDRSTLCDVHNNAQWSEMAEQASLLRDIFGPLPFRPVIVHPDVLTWNDRLVVRLAQAIYEEKRWGDLPILGDALLDSGCDEEELLSHAREQGSVHTRGCWLIDMCLGRS